ncbi:MAG: energy transducer TonB [Flavobacteriales bacterium]|jgi:protein TonB|nr:energy transducer TonB [Flavobacteriales bacterium]
MTFRSYLLLFTLLIGTYAMAQVDTPDVRLVPVLGEPAVIDVATPQEPDSTQALIMVEEMPEFPGGMPALSQYVTGELRYPKEAREMNIEGLVLVGFVVERDGSISQANVLRGIGGGCDEEALRVVARMPAWKPGQQGGTPVRVRYTLPLRFKLLGEK